MSQQYFRFKSSTNVKSLFGKDLVTDEITAIFELVKNSYDADAREVRIEINDTKDGQGQLIIVDNGTGMDLDDIENKWMVVGTDSKKNIEYSPIYQRPLNGDKGIGRFSVDRLGKKLMLITKKENIKQIKMEFDWGLFEDTYSSLDSITVPYQLNNESEVGLQGVKLVISNLRDIWDEKNILKLINSLRHFKTPFKDVKDNFSIIVHAPEYFEEEIEITPVSLEDLSNLWVRAAISKNDLSKVKITVFREGIEYNEEFNNILEFGPVYSEVFFFDTPAKIRFKSRMGMRVKEFGNIRLYRDNFRIHPYGEEWNDWLDLDRRKTQGTSRFFGTRDLIGFIQITKRHNKKIEVLTNRQGLIENEYYTQLKEFVLDFSIKMLEKYYFKKAKNESFVEAKKNVEGAVKELSRVAKEIQRESPAAAKIIRQVANVVQSSQAEQAMFVKNQEEVINVYKRVANKEVLLHKIIHEALIRMKNVQTVSSSGKRKIRNYNTQKIEQLNLIGELERDFIKIDNLTDNAKDYLLGARDHLIRVRKKEFLNMNDFAQQFLYSINESFIEGGIKITFEPSTDNLMYRMDSDDYRTIINNFVSNSIKSLKKVNKPNKEMTIRIQDNSRHIILIFKDNGEGIPENIRDRIFDPFFSTTEGFGMGLSIVDEIVKEYGGELNLAKNYTSGAEFQVKLRK